MTVSVMPPCIEWGMPKAFADRRTEPMRPTWWWSGTDLWERLAGGGVRLYRPWGPGFGCWRHTAVGWAADVPAAPLFDRRGTWLEAPCGESGQAERAARAAYFSGIPWAVRAQAARAPDPWGFLMAEAARRWR